MKHICIYIGGRANYSSIKSVMNAIKNDPEMKLSTLVGSSALLKRYGKVEDELIKDGFNIDYRFYSHVEGGNPETMVKSSGLALIEVSSIFSQMNPDCVLVVGDRFDVMPVALATAYMNIPLAHTMGGEVTGTIDESIRHALTKFANIHFPANDDAAKRILKMGEFENTVFNHGCPRNDLVLNEIETSNSYAVLNEYFENFNFLENEKYILLSQHPVTTEFENNVSYIKETLSALKKTGLPAILLHPNADAGGEDIIKCIEDFIDENNDPKYISSSNLPNRIYIHLMNTTSCLLGNSSSGIREGALIGTPVVNLGTRQNQRQAADNVITVKNNSEDIYNAILNRVEHGKFDRDELYGDGKTGVKIAKTLKDFNLKNTQKVISY